MVDRRPQGAWLTDLGTHPLRDLPCPERVVQLCHPDLVNEFPPLRTPKAVAVTITGVLGGCLHDVWVDPIHAPR